MAADPELIYFALGVVVGMIAMSCGMLLAMAWNWNRPPFTTIVRRQDD